MYPVVDGAVVVVPDQLVGACYISACDRDLAIYVDQLQRLLDLLPPSHLLFS